MRYLRIIILFFFILLPTKIFAATLYMSPSSASLSVGQSVTVTVKADSAGAALNTGEANITYSNDTLSLVSVSQGSTFSLPLPGSPGKTSSTVYFGGGIPSPGYSGSGGSLGKIVFRAKAGGTGTVSIDSGTLLLNDGLGTDAYTGGSGATFDISGEPAVKAPTEAPVTPSTPSGSNLVSVSSDTHPDQTLWYANSNPHISWVMPDGVTGVSYSFDQSPDTIPNDRIDADNTDAPNTKYTDVADGIWYFHIKGKTSSGFGDTTHFKVQIDTTPPEAFTPEAPLANGKPGVNFAAVDALSGIDHYSITLDGQVLADNMTASPYPFTKKLSSGEHVIIVTAYDKAGNSLSETTSLSISEDYILIPINLVYVLITLNSIIFLFLLYFGIYWKVWKKRNDR